MNYDVITTILGILTAVGTTVGSTLQNGGKPTGTSLAISVVAVVFGYLTNKSGSKPPNPPAVTTGNGAIPLTIGGTKSLAFKALALATITLALIFVVGCVFSTTLAQSLIAAQTSIDVADPALGAQVDKYFVAAITSAENWKTGTFSAELEQALGDLANNLDLLPLGTKADSYIAAAINLIDNELSILAKAKTAQIQSPAAMEAAYYAWIEDGNSSAPPASAGRKHQWHGKQIKTPAQLKKALKK